MILSQDWINILFDEKYLNHSSESDIKVNEQWLVYVGEKPLKGEESIETTFGLFMKFTGYGIEKKISDLFKMT